MDMLVKCRGQKKRTLHGLGAQCPPKTNKGMFFERLSWMRLNLTLLQTCRHSIKTVLFNLEEMPKRFEKVCQGVPEATS